MLFRPLPRRGVYEQPFWEHVERQDLRLQRCTGCASFRYPPGPLCPECLADQYDWVPLSGRGTVLAWTVFHRQYFPQLPVPYTVVAVATPEGPILAANYVNGAGPAACGERVRLTYELVGGELANWTIYQWESDEEEQMNGNSTSGAPA